MLFPGKQRDDDETLMGRSSGSPSFMKSVFGTGWGRRPTVGAGGGPGALQNPQDPRYHLSPELLDPFLRGAKQVLKMEYSLKKTGSPKKKLFGVPFESKLFDCSTYTTP